MITVNLEVKEKINLQYSKLERHKNNHVMTIKPG